MARKGGDVAALRKRLLKEMKGLSFPEAWQLRTRLISGHAFDTFKFRVLVKPAVKAQLKRFFVQHWNNEAKLFLATSELFEKYKSGAISEEKYVRQISTSPKAFGAHILLEDVKQFCAKHRISYEHHFGEPCVSALVLAEQMPNYEDANPQ